MARDSWNGGKDLVDAERWSYPWRRREQINILEMVEFLWKNEQKFSSFTAETGTIDHARWGMLFCRATRFGFSNFSKFSNFGRRIQDEGPRVEKKLVARLSNGDDPCWWCWCWRAKVSMLGVDQGMEGS